MWDPFPPPYPLSDPGKRNWGKIMAQASAYIDAKEIMWLGEVTALGQTFEALGDSGPLRFHSLGFKLSASLSHIIRAGHNTKSLHEDLIMHEERAQLNHTVVKGRQILFAMYGSFKTHGAMALIHSAKGL